MCQNLYVAKNQNELVPNYWFLAINFKGNIANWFNQYLHLRDKKLISHRQYHQLLNLTHNKFTGYIYLRIASLQKCKFIKGLHFISIAALL